MNQTDLREQMWLDRSALDRSDPDYIAKAKAYVTAKYSETMSAEERAAFPLNRQQRRAKASREHKW